MAYPKKTGVTDLPLHTGHAPRWLFNRMVRLAGTVTKYIVTEYGTKTFLERLADPLWFQALSCVLGFDWHSSGTTTTTTAALKIAINKQPEEFGLVVAGGKGKTSLNTPDEINRFGELLSLPGRVTEEFVEKSKLIAKVDNSCVQDGFTLYHHAFIFDEHGNYCVIQQGMDNAYARRYHWFNEQNITEAPDENIISSVRKNNVLNLVSEENTELRRDIIDVVIEREYAKHSLRDLVDRDIKEGPKFVRMPTHHSVDYGKLSLSSKEVVLLDNVRRRLETSNCEFKDLLLQRGIGPKKLRALALIAQLVYGTEIDWDDPVKYSFAHGGKDGHPYPVDRETYDASITMLEEALETQPKFLEKLHRFINGMEKV